MNSDEVAISVKRLWFITNFVLASIMNKFSRCLDKAVGTRMLLGGSDNTQG